VAEFGGSKRWYISSCMDSGRGNVVRVLKTEISRDSLIQRISRIQYPVHYGKLAIKAQIQQSVDQPDVNKRVSRCSSQSYGYMSSIRYHMTVKII
jgi:hypothetical protein